MLSIVRPATVEDLRAQKLFRDVPVKIVRKLLHKGGASLLQLQPGTALRLRRGNIENIYIIVVGYLEVRMDSQLLKKGKSFLLAFRGPEQIVGEMKAIAKERGEAFIRAIEPCQLIEIPTEALTHIAEMDWRIYRNIAALLIEKTYQERKRTEVIQMPEGEAQVAQTLLNFLDERGAETVNGGERQIKGNMRQRDVADYIGCDRTTVAKSLSKLKKRGIIEYPDQGRNIMHRLIVCDLSALEKVARYRN